VPSYDYPFNERIRTLLRLEDLFAKTLFNLNGEHKINHHHALLNVFQILDVIDRAELKTDLLQELDRQRVMLNGLLGNPSINSSVLSDTIKEIDVSANNLRNNLTKLGQPLRDNEWLMSIKQRAVIPGGVCEFDLPSYHFWLGLDTESRRNDLDQWLKSLMPIHQAITIILRILRGSGITSHFVAHGGNYQQMLGGAKPAQMLKIELSDDVNCFPEVSANKYAINIRFNSLANHEKPRLYEKDVAFTLTLCNL
jgi:cell division protein ZapD